VGEDTTLARPLDLISMQYPLLIMNAKMTPIPFGLASICVTTPENKELASRGWRIVQSLDKMPNEK
jgi:hypothetical protein